MYNLEIPGWLPKRELQELERLVSALPLESTIVEVGSYCGRSSWCIAKTAPTALVYCIDPWDTSYVLPDQTVTDAAQVGDDGGVAATDADRVGSEENFIRYTADCPNIIRVRGYSPPTSWDIPLDLVFIDGDHRKAAFKKDLEFWYLQLKPGGVLCGDDASTMFPHILLSLHEFCWQRSIKYSILGRLWSFTK